jgi:hypothetical protein
MVDLADVNQDGRPDHMEKGLQDEAHVTIIVE